MPAINTRKEIANNQYKKRNCQQSIHGKKLPAVNTRQEIARNQYKERNCQQSIQGKKCLSLFFFFSPSIRRELVLSSHWNTFNHHFKRVLRWTALLICISPSRKSLRFCLLFWAQSWWWKWNIHWNCSYHLKVKFFIRKQDANWIIWEIQGSRYIRTVSFFFFFLSLRRQAEDKIEMYVYLETVQWTRFM